MKTIAIVSGKGGTGKTSLVASFAALSSGTAVFADCDVDAANLGLIMDLSPRETHEFRASKRPVIDSERCVRCGMCAETCRYGAIDRDLGVDHFSCESCGVCHWVCPEHAISMREVVSGRWFVSQTPHGVLVHARLEPGEENSGKLVTLVRNRARELALSEAKEVVVIDGPPGIGCPVIASLAGVSCALVVTEPTLSGIHDLDRILSLCQHFRIPARVCVNRHDIDQGNTHAIKRRCREEGVDLLGTIPYDKVVSEAMIRGLPVVEYSDGEVSRCIQSLWNDLLRFADEVGVM